MYSKNLITFLTHLIDEGAVQIDREDEITAGCLLTHGGDVVHPMVREKLEAEGGS